MFGRAYACACKQHCTRSPEALQVLSFELSRNSDIPRSPIPCDEEMFPALNSGHAELMVKAHMFSTTQVFGVCIRYIYTTHIAYCTYSIPHRWISDRPLAVSCNKHGCLSPVSGLAVRFER